MWAELSLDLSYTVNFTGGMRYFSGNIHLHRIRKFHKMWPRFQTNIDLPQKCMNCTIQCINVTDQI